MGATIIENMANSTRSGGAKGTSKSPLSAPQQQQSLEKIFAMKGEGKDSYSKNSRMQASIVNFARPALDKALDKVVLPTHGPVSVADLGCSSGPNSIGSVTFIINKLRALFESLDPASPPPEFQAFFNDLPSNDFNNLFQLLSTDENRANFLAAGVPGSFYGRLFPRSSINIFFSEFCTHWLSKIPDAVLDKDSPAYNKGRIWIDGASLATATAYKEQALIDLKNFFKARAAELVPGGLLFVVLMGRSPLEPNRQLLPTFIGSMLSSVHDICWRHLISEGILTQEQMDTFNIPLYYRHREEIMEAVESCNSTFDVVTDELVHLDINYFRSYQTFDPVDLAEKVNNTMKPLFNSLLDEHIDKEAATLYWQHCLKQLENNIVPALLTSVDGVHVTYELQVLALVRK